MEQAITTSEDGISRRTIILLTLNLLGVIGCILITIMLILWARCIILAEPNTTKVIMDFIERTRKKVTMGDTKFMADNAAHDIFMRNQ